MMTTQESLMNSTGLALFPQRNRRLLIIVACVFGVSVCMCVCGSVLATGSSSVSPCRNATYATLEAVSPHISTTAPHTSERDSGYKARDILECSLGSGKNLPPTNVQGPFPTPPTIREGGNLLH